MNEVRIIVRTQNDSKAGFDAARREQESFARDAADTYTRTFGQRLAELGRRLVAPLQRAGRDVGNQLGDEIGRTASERITQRIDEGVRRSVSRARSGGLDGGRGGAGGAGGNATVNVDTDRRGFASLIAGAASAGVGAAARFGTSFVSGIQSFFTSSIIGQVVSVMLIGIGTALAIPLSAMVGAAITSGILLGLGGGVLAAGIVAAFRDPRIKAAAGDLKTQLVSMFEEFGKPFRGPVADFLEDLSRFVSSMKPDMKEIADIFAPLTGKVGDGIIGALQNAMPGILDAVKASAPFIEKLADRMPEIGQAVGDFFRKISGQGDDALVFFNDLITLVIKLIGWAGSLIATFTSWYANLRRIVTNAKILFLGFVSYVIEKFAELLNAAAVAFSWVPGLGGKLKGAVTAFARMRQGVNAELAKIHNKTVTVRVRVFGIAAANAALRTARLLAGMAHGGIKGAQDGGNKSGLTWVGEGGPELLDLPPGSRMHSAGDSRRIAGGNGGGGGGELLVRLLADRTLDRSLVGVLLAAIRLEVQRGGGNVQTVLGTGRG